MHIINLLFCNSGFSYNEKYLSLHLMMELWNFSAIQCLLLARSYYKFSFIKFYGNTLWKFQLTWFAAITGANSMLLLVKFAVFDCKSGKIAICV